MPALPHAPLTPLESGVIFHRRSQVTVLRMAAGWLARRRSRQQLAQLDAHMLRDIGLTRQDICAETEKPFWRD